MLCSFLSSSVLRVVLVIKILLFLFFLFCFVLYGSTALYGPGPPSFVEVSWSHTFETHHAR
jgi:hypothetical protein